ncbi:hypothetical protein K1719_037527 [Acacia pycnantha]|nr:hypothetical protein K1719_037527 [Acacia pycnantha]
MTNDRRLRVLDRLGFDSIRIIPSVGRSGGLVVAWNSNRNNTSSPWSVVGDFNDIQSAEERIGGRSVSLSRIRWFQDRINEAGLSDLGSVGPAMTWRGPRMDGGLRLYERLDRALGNTQFLNFFPEAYVKEELKNVLRAEEIKWFQKSRSVWVSKGDRNTHYYHLKTKMRRRRNKEGFVKPKDLVAAILNSWQLFVHDGIPADSTERPLWQSPPDSWVKINVDRGCVFY